MKNTKLVIVDDVPAVRAALKQMFSDVEIVVVGEAEGGGGRVLQLFDKPFSEVDVIKAVTWAAEIG